MLAGTPNNSETPLNSKSVTLPAKKSFLQEYTRTKVYPISGSVTSRASSVKVCTKSGSQRA